MAIGKIITGGIGIVGLLLVIVALILVGVIIGGLFGWGITILYNATMGTAFDPMFGALIGSIVGIGSASSSG